MNWSAATRKYHEISADHAYRLDVLDSDWQRELAAVFRLEEEVNNGGYLQFVANWDRETFAFAHQGLTVMGASRMAAIVHECQSLIDNRFSAGRDVFSFTGVLFENPIINLLGKTLNIPPFPFHDVFATKSKSLITSSWITQTTLQR